MVNIKWLFMLTVAFLAQDSSLAITKPSPSLSTNFARRIQREINLIDLLDPWATLRNRSRPLIMLEEHIPFLLK